MILKEYLTKEKISINRFSKKIGVSQAVCSMWVNNKRTPNTINMQKIFMITGGQVTPNDFYGIGI